MRALATIFAVSATLSLGGSAAFAQAVPERSIGFLEFAGDYGFQFGEQEYLPTGSPGESEHPLTNGFGFNVTGGMQVVNGLDLILDYSYGTAESRTGELTDVLSGVRGSIDYHAITTGVRTGREIGYGRLYGELAVGVILPFDTRLEYEYAPPMSQLGIEGTGTRIENYNLGVGAHGEAGYQIPIAGRAYLTTAMRVQGFQSNNDGRSTEYDNFVVDFRAPEAMTMDINHGTDAGATPRTYSVQDLRFHLDLGYRF